MLSGEPCHLTAPPEYIEVRAVILLQNRDTVTKRNIWLVGGEERQAVLAGLLCSDGHSVHTFAMEGRLLCEPDLSGIGQADCVILPLPATDESGTLYAPFSSRRLSAEELWKRLEPGQQVLAGRPSPTLRAAAERRGLRLRDYFAREELALLNAIPTAEGALRIAMERLPITLHGARVLLLGFGRLGQALALRLRGLGAEVSAAARRAEQRALARSMGLNSEHMQDILEWLHTYDLIFNTVPAQVLGVEELSALKEGAVVIDLASRPGGVDDESAAALNVTVIHALSLPGKEAPLTAARYLRDTVYHMLESQG